MISVPSHQSDKIVAKTSLAKIVLSTLSMTYSVKKHSKQPMTVAMISNSRRGIL